MRMPSTSSPFTWWAVALAVSFACTVGHAQSFSEQLNPTGSPIGGGEGYAQAVPLADATTVVQTRAELVAALGSAQPGDVVFVADGAEIDLTGERELAIPGGVTLAGSRGQNGSSGALITYGSTFPDAELAGLFVTSGPDARITGLRLRGPSSDAGDHGYDEYGVAYGVRPLFPGLEVDNCELYAWGKWAIWLYDAHRAHIHHNSIHHNRRDGYGYGIWIGHRGDRTGDSTLVEANLFSFNRHSLASSGADNSWEVRYNVFLENSLFYDVDRHDQGASGGGGRETLLHHNLFFGTYTKHFSVAFPLPNGELRVTDNWFAQPDLRAAGQMAGSNMPADEVDQENVVFENNAYGGAGAVLPNAELTASTVEGYAPLTVAFDASASTAADGSPAHHYAWHFADGDDYGDGLGLDGPTAQHTFTEPGVYPVTVRAFDDFGVPGTTVQHITVLPRPGGRWLSAWIRDSYPGALTGFYEAQLRVDDEVVWSDDVAGAEGWQHVVVDVSGRPGPTMEVEIRLVATESLTDPENQITEMSLFADDVAVLGGEVISGGFEGPGGWRATQDGTSNWGWQTPAGVVRSGTRSVRRRVGLRQETVAGQWAGAAQTVTLGAPIAQGGPEETEQLVALRSGWNLIALRVRPADDALSSVLGAGGEVITAVEDVSEQSLWSDPAAVWDPTLAYLVQASEAVTFPVSGVPIEVAEIEMELHEGWNFVPYFGQAPISTAEAFAPLGDALVLVQDVPAQDEEARTYAPGYGVAELSALTPGRGYRVFVDRDVLFTYPQ